MTTLDHIQANPTLFDRHVAEGARQLGFELDDYLRTQNIDSLPDANQYEITGINTVGKELEFRQLCMDWIQQTAVMADRDNWPIEDRVIVGMPEFTDAIVSYLTQDKPNLGMGQIVDEAFRDHGVAKVYGFNIIKDLRFPVVAVNANFAQALIRGENSGLVFAEQWYNFDAFRSQAFHGDVIWGLHVYTPLSEWLTGFTR